MDFIHTITQQQELFCSWVSTPLSNIAKDCAGVWNETCDCDERLSTVLKSSIKQLPQYSFCYLISPEGKLLTPTFCHDESSAIEIFSIGRDVSARPYFVEWESSNQKFFLSHPYVSILTGRLCMTAMQAVHIDSGTVAVLAIDFDGSRSNSFNSKPVWDRAHIQTKGDPSIRQQLFQQTRTITPMEEQIDDVHCSTEKLFLYHGAFFVQLRYSRSTATARFTENPYFDASFQLDQLLNSDSTNRQPMSSMSIVTESQIKPVLQLFKKLRLADENIYLRSASLNLISGLVELNFSCDGTHNLPVEQFLEKSADFWLGTS